MPRLAPSLLLALAACTASAPREAPRGRGPVLTFDASKAAIPWQTRCAETVVATIADAAVEVPPLIGRAKLTLESLPLDNYTWHSVHLHTDDGALDVWLMQRDPLIPEEHEEGWLRQPAREEGGARVVWRRDTALATADIEFAMAALGLAGPALPESHYTQDLLRTAADVCLAEWSDWPELHARVLAGEPLTGLKQRGAQ